MGSVPPSQDGKHRRTSGRLSLMSDASACACSGNLLFLRTATPRGSGDLRPRTVERGESCRNRASCSGPPLCASGHYDGRSSGHHAGSMRSPRGGRSLPWNTKSPHDLPWCTKSHDSSHHHAGHYHGRCLHRSGCRRGRPRGRCRRSRPRRSHPGRRKSQLHDGSRSHHDSRSRHGGGKSHHGRRSRRLPKALPCRHSTGRGNLRPGRGQASPVGRLRPTPRKPSERSGA
mmetsp:Transcript_68744/g.161119  ORF Transcript_68744/g.161119 Transcript_68744/m.161119 type:complete len:230 (-) Transcript_68744:1173-1862(-)